jgi:hypothetical protein
MINRRADWPDRLMFEITHTDRFVWGVCDCALFAANCIESMTNVDVARKFRGKYKTARGAYGAIKRECGKAGLEALAVHIASVYGFQDTPLALAQRGDVVLTDDTDGAGPALGVCAGADFVYVGPEGIGRKPMTSARRAWAIAR